MSLKKQQVKTGFTLIELLLSVGIISVLASIIIIAVNPSRQLMSARDAERQHNVNQLQKAMDQYFIDIGSMPGDKEIYEGEGNMIYICQETETHAGCINLDDLLPNYVGYLPVDPLETSSFLTGYATHLHRGRPRIIAIYMGDEERGGPTDYAARWSLEDGEGAQTFTDRSGNGLDGSCSGGQCPTIVAGKFGSALSFSASSSQFISIADSDSIDFDTNDDFAISLWIKMPAIQSDTGMNQNGIIEKMDGSYPYVINIANQTHGSNGSIIAARYDGAMVPAVISTTACNDDAWHHVLFMKNSSTLGIYIDGTLEDTSADNTTSPTTNDAPLWVGKRQAAATYLDGILDDLRIYNRALTVTEINNLASGT